MSSKTWLDRPVTAALVFLALAFVWMWPSSLRPHDTISDVGDPLHLAYILAWNAHQLIANPFHLFEANSFYPWPQSLAFADHLMPESLLVAPVNWLSGNAVLGYNVAVFAGLFLSAWSMRWLILDATGNARAALLAGLVYGFNGFTLVEANRLQVIHLQWWPAALVFLGRFVADPSFGRALGLGIALAMQGLSGSYYLAFSALVAPVWLGLALAGTLTRPTLRMTTFLILAALLSAIPVALLIAPYLLRGLPRGTVSGGVNLLAYVSPAPGSLWSSLLTPDTLGREFKGVFGLALMAAGIVAMLRSRPGWFKALALVALATASIGVVLSMGDILSVGGSSYGPGPHRWLLKTLPLEGLRHTPRFNALAVLGGAILAGLGAARWLGRSTAATVATVALCAILPFEQWSRTGYGVRLPASALLRSAYRDLPGGPLVDLPLYPIPQRRYWAAYPFLSTYHWNPVPIGRTSFYPPGHEYLAWLLDGFPDDNSLGVLSRLGVRTAVVHPRIWPDDDRGSRLDRLKDTKTLVRLDRSAVAFEPNILELGDELYFRIEAPPPPPPLCKPADEVPGSSFRVFAMGEGAPEESLALIADRDPSTRWSSGADQSGWYGFQIQLKPAETLAALVVETPADRFPRVWPSLELRAPEGAWTPVSSPFSPEVAWETLEGQLGGVRTARHVIRFPRQEVRAFRLAFPIFVSRPAPNFQIEEIRAFRDCRP